MIVRSSECHVMRGTWAWIIIRWSFTDVRHKVEFPIDDKIIRPCIVLAGRWWSRGSWLIYIWTWPHIRPISMSTNGACRSNVWTHSLLVVHTDFRRSPCHTYKYSDD